MSTPPNHPSTTSIPSRPPTVADIDRQISNAALRSRRHWFDDGIWEIAIGIIFATLGVYFALETAVAATVSRRGVVANVLLNLLLPVIVIVAALLGRRLIHRAKERLVYPRAGFVRYRRTRQRPKWLSGVIGGVVAALMVVLVRSAPGVEAWIPAAVGLLFAAGAFWLSRFSGVPRIFWLGIVAALAGVVVSLFHSSAVIDGALFYGTVGLAMITSGAVAVRRFLREAPPPEQS